MTDNFTQLKPFGLQIENYNKDDKIDLEQLVWQNGFVVLKKLDTHWSVINDIAHKLGNVADASPVDHPECKYVGQITGQKYEDGSPKGRMGKSTEIGLSLKKLTETSKFSVNNLPLSPIISFLISICSNDFGSIKK